MTLPEGFKCHAVCRRARRVQPIAMALDDRGRLWIAEAYSYPIRLPDDRSPRPHPDLRRHQRRRQIRQADGVCRQAEPGQRPGGRLRRRVGRRGPAFAVHSRRRRRRSARRPAASAARRLGLWQDTHETLNTFIWGPDGWLYGCHGVFTHSNVGKPGTPDDERQPINCGIWRYHPTRHEFEVFAHGTSNPWGVDFNDHGHAFLTACVIPHLYHMIQGARYERQGGRALSIASPTTTSRRSPTIGITPAAAVRTPATAARTAPAAATPMPARWSIWAARGRPNIAARSS